jgi:cyclopropane fatty-acyl-phospholipid synthase-like methyltransferase
MTSKWDASVRSQFSGYSLVVEDVLPTRQDYDRMLRAKLERVCAHWNPFDFNDLLEKMIAVKQRWPTK